MIQKFITIITNLIALIFDGRKTVADLKQQVADRDKIIADLHTAIDANTANDVALVQAKADALAAQKVAEEALAATNAEIADASAKADALAASITADPVVPITVTTDGTVTPQETPAT